MSATDDALLLEQPDGSLREIEELRRLVSEGKERGYLTFQEVAACLEDVEVTKEQVSQLHGHLLEQGVEVVAEDTVAPAQDGDRKPHADARHATGRKKAELDLTVEPSLDALRLYLRAIGRVELLTAAGEVALAKRIE